MDSLFFGTHFSVPIKTWESSKRLKFDYGSDETEGPVKGDAETGV